MNRNIREDVIFFCGLDGERLLLQEGRHTIYYRCPKYKKENRNENEKPCINRISLLDANFIYDELEYVQASNELKEGYKGVIKEYYTFVKSFDISYEIKEINEDFIKVYLINNNRQKKKYIYDKNVSRGVAYASINL